MAKKFNILIIGGGPTGLVLANLLGRYDIDVLLIEAQPAVYPIPRATHIDEETLRNFQLTGLLPLFQNHIAPFGAGTVATEKGKVIFAEQMIQEAGMHHFKGSFFFHQPAFENILWDGLQRYPSIEVLRGYEAVEIHQLPHEIAVTAINRDTKETKRCSGQWLAGCDGGRSMVREAAGIGMTALEPARDWVIVDSLLKDAGDAILLPPGFRYLLGKSRLTIYAHGIGLNRRWEFQLHKGETMPDDDTIKAWVSRYMALEKIDITRIAKYAHHALLADTWKQQRILLAGDAAHMMPPSAGQGLCSGIRDAVNLAWKLAAVVQGHAPASLLDTYEQERKPHLHSILRRTLFFSRTLQGDTYWQRLWRHISIRCIETLTPLKNYLRKKYNTPPALKEGFLCTGTLLAGMHLPQFLPANGQLTDKLAEGRFMLVCRPGMLTGEQRARLHVLVIIDTIPFIQWLDEHHIDFALVRPDKIIYGTGKAAAWEDMLKKLRAAVNPELPKM
jgi:3-(3-hydroxy-phenyl)propionate hydroxylase